MADKKPLSHFDIYLSMVAASKALAKPDDCPTVVSETFIKALRGTLEQAQVLFLEVVDLPPDESDRLRKD